MTVANIILRKRNILCILFTIAVISYRNNILRKFGKAQAVNEALKIKKGIFVHNDIYGHISEVPSREGVIFNYLEQESDDRFSNIGIECVIPSWNTIRTDEIPDAEAHDRWMKLNNSRKNYLYHESPCPFAAYLYEKHIAVTLTSENQFGKKMICRYFDCNMVEIPDQFESKVFPESTVFCARRPGAVYISVTYEKDSIPEPPVHIQKRIDDVPSHFFTVCLASLYGDEPKFIQIVDFIEYYKLQGATKIHIYLRNVTNYDRQLLDDYVRTGEIETITVHDNWWRHDFMWHMAQINDCHFRSRNFAKWTAFIDIDERIEMKNHVKTVAEYLNSIRDPNINNLVFSIQWVMKTERSPEKYVNDSMLLEHMVFRKYHTTSAVGKHTEQPKCIIRPEKIGAMEIHGPRAVYSGFIQTFVPPRTGVVRHYRNMFGNRKTDEGIDIANKHGPFTETDIAPWIVEQLPKSIIDRIHKVYKIHDNFTCEQINDIYKMHYRTAQCYRDMLAEKKKNKNKKKQ